MTRLPPFEPLERLGAGPGTSDFNQRHGRAAPPRGPAGLAGGRWRHRSLAPCSFVPAALRGLNPRRLALLLGVVRWPWRIFETRRLLRFDELEQPVQRPWGRV